MINKLRNEIIRANDLYRIGKPIMSDGEYDSLLEKLSMLSPGDELLSKVGHTVVGDRKSKLPVEMASMEKTKSLKDIHDWYRLKNISKDELVIITPKYDGISLCVNEITKESWTRGDGKFGQKSDEHYDLMKNKLISSNIESKKYNSYTPSVLFTYGEVMIPKSVFIEKYSSDFANPRNLVGGLINSKDISESLKDCNYIKYGIFTSDRHYNSNPFDTKQETLDFLNKNQSIKVEYLVCKLSEITEDLLINLFHKWGIDYEIDGVIIEVNDLKLQENLGRETSSNNPVWARAFKHPSFEQSAETEVTGISWNISKQGYLKPIIHVNPVKLDGVTVSNVTGNNARFILDMGIGVGSIVVVKRSGMVIPLIVSVLKSVDFVMPNIPNIDWNENGIELVTLTETDDQRLKQLVSFFEILEAKNVSEGIIKQLWDAGYKTVKEILSLSPSDMEKLDRFGKIKSSIVYNSIQGCVRNVSLSKLQHATGIFKGLGSKKLLLLEHFDNKPTINEVMNIDGFAETSAKSYLDGYDRFNDFIKDLPITISHQEVVEAIGNDMSDKQFVFTGVRRHDLEQVIESRGGKIGSGVSKNTTYLVMKSVGSGSSKEKKAIDMGVKIITVDELEKLLK